MTTDNPRGDIERRKEVARRVDGSADYLYQIAAGIKLKSGRPRTVGRDLRAALDREFPGWLDAASKGAADELPISATPPQLDLASLFANAVAAMPPARWRSVRAQLDALAASPEMLDDVLPELRTLLNAPSEKQQAQA